MTGCRPRQARPSTCTPTLRAVAPLPSPRTWLEHPDDFGRVTEPRWREDADAMSAAGKVGVDAAKLQHEIALFVRQGRVVKGWDSWAAVAANLPLDVAEWQLRSIMRGTSHMSLRHITALQAGFPNLVYGPLAIRRMLRRINQLEHAHRD